MAGGSSMSSTEPLVCAVMLTRDRPAMAKRAVEAFRAQTYRFKMLLVFDSGALEAFGGREYDWLSVKESSGEPYRDTIINWDARDHVEKSIGLLRNGANALAKAYGAEIIIHWDDDDLSHPNRIAEQVALQQASGAEAVGYNEVLFWDASSRDYPRPGGIRNEAWIWRAPKLSPACGSSLCYWRKTWEQHPFKDRQRGEDYWWMKQIHVSSVSSLPLEEFEPAGPRLICSIHAGNAASYDLEALVRGGSTEWRRAPEWDAYARERMAL